MKVNQHGGKNKWKYNLTHFSLEIVLCFIQGNNEAVRNDEVLIYLTAVKIFRGVLLCYWFQKIIYKGRNSWRLTWWGNFIYVNLVGGIHGIIAWSKKT